MDIRKNLFGQGPKAGRPQAGYDRPPPPPRDDTPMMGGYEDFRGDYTGPPRGSYGAPQPSPRQVMPSRPTVGRQQQPMSPAKKVQLRIAKVEDKTLANQYIFGNLWVSFYFSSSLGPSPSQLFNPNLDSSLRNWISQSI
jgi:vesicle-fusing ATPase